MGGLLEQVNSSNESLMLQQGQVDERNEYGEEEQEFLNSNEDTLLERNREVEGMRCETGFVTDNVVNLWKHILTDDEIRLFCGLKFCPMPREINNFKLNQDSADFSRRMKCKAFFEMEKEGLGNAITRDSLDRFKETSKWVLTKVDPALEL